VMSWKSREPCTVDVFVFAVTARVISCGVEVNGSLVN
jgi:hypothetical protein